jgi:hypothetical protein
MNRSVCSVRISHHSGQRDLAIGKGYKAPNIGDTRARGPALDEPTVLRELGEAFVCLIEHDDTSIAAFHDPVRGVSDRVKFPTS